MSGLLDPELDARLRRAAWTIAGVVALAAGPTHNLALRADASVVSWAKNIFACTNVPASLTNAIALAAGFSRNMALIGDGPPVINAPLSDPTMDANGFRVSLPTQSGRVYRLEYKDSLADAEWVHLPLGHFSDATIQQLRIVHVLNGKEVRSYAAEFIRKA